MRDNICSTEICCQTVRANGRPFQGRRKWSEGPRAAERFRLRSPPSGPLSGSRAAAHVVACQIPGGSGGHVSGNQRSTGPTLNPGRGLQELVPSRTYFWLHPRPATSDLLWRPRPQPIAKAQALVRPPKGPLSGCLGCRAWLLDIRSEGQRVTEGRVD
ncbi:unnamed protein product [Rangifer tarandus platyrhynchus]|uniref:Uncharacterized protein n=2 Tax=Rangifer tarandus platyrhynchus TaxID=3082113 RepID=A0ACB0F1Z9_RANTA|nr:unnamed protein product [Rangifer tarandus platyrhynchus]CAI9706946.1 unnamed protein product [Rangifer tarandus platyrhynchus]